MIEIKIPSPGESVTEVEISNWLVDSGDYVEKDQEIAEIESDKATLPLIASESGTLEIIVPAGEAVKVGTVACKIDPSGEPKETKPSQKEEEKKEKSSTKDQASRKEEPKEKSPEKKNTEKTGYEDVKVSPVAKKMMQEEGVDLEAILKGLKRIGKQEVEQALAQPGASNVFSGTKEVTRNEERKKMSQLRKKLSQRLVSVKNETAMLTTFNEVDMTEIIALRKKYQSRFLEKHGIKLGFMSFFTRAVTLALKAFPAVNSQIDGEEIIYPDYSDIGIAVQTPKGLMVPVVRNAETMNLAELELKIKELADKGRAGRISIDDLTGGTFTITNGGVFGSLLSTPILNPPQSGILGMHNIQDRPVAVNGKVEIRPMMYIALSYDHRTIDGKESVGFLVKVKELLEAPYKLLLGEKSAEEMLLDL
ncbi:MAG: 2-oxoglutarate dehydrogenase complex dihydrolipoyllysine-residue succinyltransferase [Bacteroidales bacterium]|jgi:2-oxoglutarate dehydrogenase E2 component (dihydrolipoamide succinyltransferase)|nr:2-oxoglutarate dehydrogenase complex dihydrolipoyllysine-residue succinyltransferase [Bacteroidales bacterium]